MERDARNLRAWQSRANWIGPPWLGLYRAADDDRVWVSKWPKLPGWTVNLARPGGLATLAVLLALTGLAIASRFL